MKMLKWKILLAVGFVPFVVVLIGGIVKIATGFLGDTGMDAFWSWVVLCSFIYWPAYLIGFALIAISAAKLLGRTTDGKEENI